MLLANRLEEQVEKLSATAQTSFQTVLVSIVTVASGLLCAIIATTSATVVRTRRQRRHTVVIFIAIFLVGTRNDRRQRCNGRRGIECSLSVSTTSLWSSSARHSCRVCTPTNRCLIKVQSSNSNFSIATLTLTTQWPELALHCWQLVG